MQTPKRCSGGYYVGRFDLRLGGVALPSSLTVAAMTLHRT
jgi:hypothetical protein